MSLWPALAACLLLTGCGSRPDVPPLSPSSTSATATTEPVSYPMDLYTHCGVEFTSFDGRTWKVVEPVPDPDGTPFARGAVNHLPGTATLTDENTLRFTVADDSPYLPGEVVTVAPTSEAVPLCQ
jgi:hypothetical protein